MSGVTRNDPRNRLITALARDLADRATRSSTRFRVVADAADIPGSVVVLARDCEHAARLRRLQRAADRDRIAIVPPDEAAGVGDVVGIVVRADGGSGLPSLPPSWLVESQTVRSPLLVIDVPVPHPAFRRDERRRERAYREAGWVPLAAEIGGYADWDRWVWDRRMLNI
jgi:hypothetical protein